MTRGDTHPAPDPQRLAPLAAAVTLLFPGAGHMLVRDWGRGALWALGWLVVLVAGGGHSLATVALAVIAAADAYVRARAAGPPRGDGVPG
ncbi:MAG: hypothetical protein HZB46_15315 [Solirubrobacterales bacterium]|nr:hypothetical protein [Solirubrobacterales bacterium]